MDSTGSEWSPVEETNFCFRNKQENIIKPDSLVALRELITFISKEFSMPFAVQTTAELHRPFYLEP